ncbi:hypothetical protein GCM10010389_33390 [Streptomyces echinoruber]|uniref:Uncharacterized protein n=1 Tax=Streptomyces echinoruber TaxID=68898 RepID=A0A918VE21_9ACTN|nr:hypothetical protein GCM10010389_33390 [Streptomyces echinoruber]
MGGGCPAPATGNGEPPAPTRLPQSGIRARRADVAVVDRPDRPDRFDRLGGDEARRPFPAPTRPPRTASHRPGRRGPADATGPGRRGERGGPARYGRGSM